MFLPQIFPKISHRGQSWVKYNGRSYYLLTDDDHVAVCDSNFTEEYETFKDAVELIEKYRIDGKSLLELIDFLEEVEPE